jgi:hypothetical protein
MMHGSSDVYEERAEKAMAAGHPLDAIAWALMAVATELEGVKIGVQ